MQRTQFRDESNGPGRKPTGEHPTVVMQPDTRSLPLRPNPQLSDGEMVARGEARLFWQRPPQTRKPPTPKQ